VILGDGCVIGHGSELKNAILLDGAHAAHLCYVGDSVVGPKANLGAGVKCSNLRLDSREISVICDGQKIKTGLKKLGAILGEGVQVGCNCVLNPGTLIGKKSEIYPLLNVGGWVPPYSRVKSALNWVIEPKVEKILKKMMHEF
jgi:NDP-sugar pyrophosphorylase family protein